MTAIYLNTTTDSGRSYRRSLITRRLIAIWIMIAVAALSLPLCAQTKVPSKISAQKTQSQLAQTKPAAAIAEVKVPNLVWLPRESALEVLRRARLQPQITADDNQPGSVVIEQTPAVDATVPAYTKVSYKVGRPVLKLEASPRSVRVHGNVHFKVILTPPATSANGQGLPVVYAFVWRRGEKASQETTDAFVKEAPQASGFYAAMVSVTVNDVPLESNAVEIKVEPKVSVTTTPTPPTPTPEPYPKLLGLILLAAVVLGTLAAAYVFHKLKKGRVAATAKVKVSTVNRQVHAKILQPQSLKSKCLTRVRWVRGPLFKTMLPQEKIVKKKGAAHG